MTDAGWRRFRIGLTPDARHAIGLPVGKRWYIALGAAVVTLHAVLALVMNGTKDFGDVGPLSMPTVTGRAEEALIAPVGAIGAEEALNRCFPGRSAGSTSTFRVTGGEVLGRWLYACREIRPSGMTTVAVVDHAGRPVRDVLLLKPAGVWPEVAAVSTGWGLLVAWLTGPAVFLLGWIYYSRPRPGPPNRSGSGWIPWWTRRGVAWVLLVVPVISWISLARSPWITRGLKVRLALQALVVAVTVFIVFMLEQSIVAADPWGLWSYGMATTAMLLATLGGWRWLMSNSFDHPDIIHWPTGFARPHSGGEGARGTLPPSAPPSGYPDPVPEIGPPMPTYGTYPPVPVQTPVAQGSVTPGSLPEEQLRRFRANARTRLVFSRVALRTGIGVAGIMAMLVVSAVTTVRSTATTVPVGYGIVAMFYIFFFVIPAGVVAAIASPLILGWRRPARILLLRPFDRPDHSRALRGLVRREMAGYGHVYSLADTAITVRWFIKIPLMVGQLGLMSFRSRRVSGAAELQKLLTLVDHRFRRNLNWAVARSKVFAIRSTDDMWRPTVGELMKRVDAILIDVTEVTDGLCWELSAVQDLGRFDDCIFLSSDDSQHRSAPVVANQLGRPVVLNGFDGTGRLTEPVQFRQNLSSILFRRAHPDDRAPWPTPFPAP